MHSIFTLVLFLGQLATALPPSTLRSNYLVARSQQGEGNNANPSTTFYLRNFTYGGAGCPQGSATNNASEFKYTNFYAAIGPGIPSYWSRTSCIIVADLVYPKDVRFKVRPTKPFLRPLQVILDAGTRATYRANYYFAGGAAEAAVQYNFAGPYNQVVYISDPSEGFESPRSPCGGEALLSIAREFVVYASNPSSTGYIQHLDEEGSTNMAIPWDGFEWGKC